jgi:hypothetical protein
MDDPTVEEALEWARNLLGEKQPTQLGAADKVSIYASYAQFRSSKRTLDVSQGILDTSKSTQVLSQSVLKSSKNVETMTLVVMTLTVLIGLVASMTYFAQIVGLYFAPIISFGLFYIIFLILKREVGRRQKAVAGTPAVKTEPETNERQK